MAGISAVNMLGYMNKLSAAFQGQPLTPATKAKLTALGYDTSSIKTEAEGRMKLQELLLDKTQSSDKTKKTNKSNGEDYVMAKVKRLADELNVSYSDDDTVDDIINRITTKVEELMAKAGDDKDKKADAIYYGGRLNEVKRMLESQIDLSGTMNMTANMNIAFHGLY
ncbi:MAG: hypothetical protein K6A44_04975 [bacterium]|nr:hypothetical protein [bacterium]